jgi:rhodanese-related sulfurtransferase
LLEFKLVLNSSDNPFDIKDNTNLLVYCAGGYRSALAGKTLLDLGFKNILILVDFRNGSTQVEKFNQYNNFKYI